MKSLIDNLGLCFQNIFDMSSEGLKQFSVNTGWIIDLEVIKDVKLLARLHELFQKGEFDKATKLYKRYIMHIYGNDKIDEILLNWSQNSTLNNRIEILVQSLKAHQMKMYYVSVPAMLAQIEGYIWEFNKYDGILKQKQLKLFINNQEHLSIFTESLGDYMENVIFTSFKLGENIGSEINRNAILHGYSNTYGTKESSLKLIIIMNVIQFFYSNVIVLEES